MSKNKNDEASDLKRYKDSSGLTIQKLNFGLWLSEKRQKITKLFVLFLIVLSVTLFAYSSYNYIVYFSDDSDYNIGSLNLVTSPKNLVSDLEISRPIILKNEDNYDLAVLIKNPNNYFVARFKYCFVISQSENLCSDGFIFPNEEKYFSVLGRKSDSGFGDVGLVLNDLSWRRIDAHAIPDWGVFTRDHLNFAIDNVEIFLANEKSTSNNTDTLSFVATNRSPYSYYELPLTIAFYNNENLIAINTYLLQKFLSGEKREVRLSWPGYLAGVTRTQITPHPDLFNNEIYLKYQGAN